MQCKADAFCSDCHYGEEHDKLRHTVMPLVLSSEADANLLSDLSHLKSDIWLKYEQFFFVVNPENELFRHIQLYFSFMQECYIKLNNICEEKKEVDFVMFMLDQNFAILSEEFK